MKLATLEAIVAQRASDARQQVVAGQLIRDWEEQYLVRDWEEQWVYRLPESLTSSLAQLQLSEIPSIAAAWAATEEWRLDGITSATDENFGDLVHLVGELCRFAQQAQQAGKSMYMWISL